MSEIRFDVTHLHKPAREQAANVAAAEFQPVVRMERPADVVQLQNSNALDCIIPSESAVRMIPAIQNAFASLSQGDGRGGEEQQRQQRHNLVKK